MKKIGLIILMNFMVMAVSFAQTTAIPDSNFEAFLISQGIDTNGANGNILNADAQAVINLNVTVNTITDFTGLEAFVNLVTLNLGTNQFATVPLNNLTLLEELYFEHNNTLVSLDVSNNTKLRVLDIRGPGIGSTQAITDLDLSKNILLERIYIYDFRNLVNVTYPDTDTVTYVFMLLFAPITVDFSGYDNLETIFLSTNFNNTLPINAILPNNQNTLKSASFQGGNITTVNLSNFLALEYISLQSCNTETLLLPQTGTLKKIRISGHKIDNISFENASMLEDLEIDYKAVSIPLNLDVTKNTQLRKLNASSNYMLTLDVIQNTILEDLNFSNNQIAAIDISKNTVLKYLNGNNNKLPTLDLTHNPLLVNVTLRNNLLPDLNVRYNPVLGSLNIGTNLFTGTGLDLSQNPELVYLNAEKNQIESLDITHNLKLSTIILNHNLFRGTAILDQFYAIRLGADGLFGGTLDVAYNQLTGTIPNFFDMVHLGDDNKWTRRFNLYIDNNEFHFGDFEDQHLGYVGLLTTLGSFNIPVFANYSYAPQAKVNAIENPVKNAGESITMLTEVRGSQNHYKWFKDGAAIPGAPDSPELILNDLTDCDAGVYYCEIRSDLFPFENANPPGTGGKNLLLVRNDITLTINVTKTCVTLADPVNGATAVPVNSGISWNGNPGACGYRISVGTTSGGTDIVNNENVGKVTLYNFAGNLPSNTQIFVRITPYFSDGNLSGCAVQSFTTNATEVVPDCTFLTNPINGAVNVAVDTDISWNPANAADGYRLRIGTTSGGTDIINNIDVGNTTIYDLPSDLPEGTQIFVTVVPYNSVGNASGCSEEHFTTATVLPVPMCTALTMPLNGTANVAVNTNLNWTAIAEADGYFLSVGTGFGQTDILNKVDVGNLTSYDFASDLPPDSDIHVKIIPYNSQHQAIGCSEESFTTAAGTSSTPPSCTTLIAPVNGASNVSVGTGLSWNTVSDAAGYRLSVGTTFGGTDLVNNTDVGNVTSYTFSNDLPDNTTIYISLTPYNASGDATGCAVQSFTTAPVATIPSCTTLSTPVNGSTNVVVSTNLVWNSVSNANGYRLSVGTTSGGTDIVNNSDVGNVTIFDFVFDLPENTTIFINITPYNSVGDATGCNEISFTTETVASVPACTVITSPADGATGVSVSTNITWSAVSNADDYLITIGTTSGGSDIASATVTGTSYDPAADFSENTTYYVSVIPQNSIGAAAGCSEISFTTETLATAPGCSSISSPADGATGVSVRTNITWSAVSNADDYLITIGTTPGGSDIASATVTGTSYDPSSDFAENTTYYVSVIPQNSIGAAAGCSEISFTTETLVTVPACTVITNPADGAINVSISIQITWDAVANADGYLITAGTSLGTGDILENVDVGNTDSYTFSNDLPESTTVYIIVVPYNATGIALGCSNISFTTQSADIAKTEYGISPNGDGINDQWVIEGIESFPGNTVSIFNRWGDRVYMVSGYNNTTVVFDGRANRLQGMGAGELPEGTYFFEIKIPGREGIKGFLILKR